MIEFDDDVRAAEQSFGGHVMEGNRMTSDTKAEAGREPMLQFFNYGHLPERLRAVSQPFGDLAEYMAAALPRNPERTAGLRKLLEAKDCAVRAMIYEDGD